MTASDGGTERFQAPSQIPTPTRAHRSELPVRGVRSGLGRQAPTASAPSVTGLRGVSVVIRVAVALVVVRLRLAAGLERASAVLSPVLPEARPLRPLRPLPPLPPLAVPELSALPPLAGASPDEPPTAR